jgi:hypothetical protein
MGGLAAFAQALAAFIVGPFGISTITFAIAGVAICCSLHLLRWSHLWGSIGAGAFAFGAGWIVTTFLQV